MSNILTQVEELENQRKAAKDSGNSIYVNELTKTINDITTTSEYCFAYAYHLNMQTGEPWFVLQINHRDWANMENGYHCVSQSQLESRFGHYFRNGLITQMSRCSIPIS